MAKKPASKSKKKTAAKRAPKISRGNPRDHAPETCKKDDCPLHQVEVFCPTKGCGGHYFRTKIFVKAGTSEICGSCTKDVVYKPK